MRNSVKNFNSEKKTTKISTNQQQATLSRRHMRIIWEKCFYKVNYVAVMVTMGQVVDMGDKLIYLIRSANLNIAIRFIFHACALWHKCLLSNRNYKQKKYLCRIVLKLFVREILLYWKMSFDGN